MHKRINTVRIAGILLVWSMLSVLTVHAADTGMEPAVDTLITDEVMLEEPVAPEVSGGADTETEAGAEDSDEEGMDLFAGGIEILSIEEIVSEEIEDETEYVPTAPPSGGSGRSVEPLYTSGTIQNMIWNYLTGKGLSYAGTAGIMGNFKVESGLRPNNLENSSNDRCGLSDAAFTSRVDSGEISRAEFIVSGTYGAGQYGYGLAQWTAPGRKAALYDYAKGRGTSVGNLQMQLDFFWNELSGYSSLVELLSTTVDVTEACVQFHNVFEQSSDTPEEVLSTRVPAAVSTYNRYVDPDIVYDDEAPVITGVSVSDVTEDGYTISCVVMDNDAVECVQFPTWAVYEEQEELQGSWENVLNCSASVVENEVIYRVKLHPQERQCLGYVTHVYAYDRSGNCTQKISAVVLEDGAVVPGSEK